MSHSLPPLLPDQASPSAHRPPWLIAFDHSFVVMPLVTITTLVLLAVRASMHLGHWPQPWIDDPKFIAPHDPLLMLFYWLVLPGLLWSMAGIMMVPQLTVL
jgi:hypothetical protein